MLEIQEINYYLKYKSQVDGTQHLFTACCTCICPVSQATRNTRSKERHLMQFRCKGNVIFSSENHKPKHHLPQSNSYSFDSKIAA